MGSWHWKGPAYFPDKAGVGGLLAGAARASDLPHPKVAKREGHIPVSVMPGMWFPSGGEEEEEDLRMGAEPSWGLRLGKGQDLQSQEDPAGLEGRRCVCCPVAGVPSGPRQAGMRREQTQGAPQEVGLGRHAPCLGHSGPLGMGGPGEGSVPWTRTSCSQWGLVVSG